MQTAEGQKGDINTSSAAIKKRRRKRAPTELLLLFGRHYPHHEFYPQK